MTDWLDELDASERAAMSCGECGERLSESLWEHARELIDCAKRERDHVAACNALPESLECTIIFADRNTGRRDQFTGFITELCLDNHFLPNYGPELICIGKSVMVKIETSPQIKPLALSGELMQWVPADKPPTDDREVITWNGKRSTTGQYNASLACFVEHFPGGYNQIVGVTWWAEQLRGPS